MKKMLFALALCLCSSVTIRAQEIFKEVQSLMQKNEAIKNNKSKNLETRKIATFKSDALYYLIMKAGSTESFTEHELGEQANAMIEFVNLYVKSLANNAKKSNQEVTKAKYKNASINNSRFNDMDKEITYAYVDNSNYITNFSLDTDWVKALAEVKK